MYEFKFININYYKVTPGYVKNTRKFFRDRVKKSFVKYLAYEGYFNDIFNKKELKDAKVGKLPNYLDIHHIIPISGGGTNSFDNLVVLDKVVHKYINKEYFQPQLSKHINDPYGSVLRVIIPVFDSYTDTENIKLCQKIRRMSIVANKRGQNYFK